MSETIRAHIPGTGIACDLYTATIGRVRRVAGGYMVDSTRGRYFVEAKDGKALRGRVGMRVSVTYDLVTRESSEDGATADNGYIDARTEQRRSFSNGRTRDIERNRRIARAGRCDFHSLREAMAFIERQCCEHMETCWTGPLGAAGESTLSVYCTGARDEYESELFNGSRIVSTDYCLHIDGCSAGTADRIARLLAANGVYFANRRDLQRRKAG